MSPPSWDPKWGPPPPDEPLSEMPSELGRSAQVMRPAGVLAACACNLWVMLLFRLVYDFPSWAWGLVIVVALATTYALWLGLNAARWGCGLFALSSLGVAVWRLQSEMLVLFSWQERLGLWVICLASLGLLVTVNTPRARRWFDSTPEDITY